MPAERGPSGTGHDTARRETGIRERAERGAYGYESDVREDTFFLLARIADLREEVAEYVAAFGPMDFVARGKIKRTRDA